MWGGIHQFIALRIRVSQVFCRASIKKTYTFTIFPPRVAEKVYEKMGQFTHLDFFFPIHFISILGRNYSLWQTLRTLLNRLDGREDPFKFLRVVEVGHVIDHHGTHLGHRCDYGAFNLINDWHDQRKVD